MMGRRVVQIFTKQKYIRRNWSGENFGGVYDWGGGVGGLRGAFLFL